MALEKNFMKKYHFLQKVCKPLANFYRAQKFQDLSTFNSKIDTFSIAPFRRNTHQTIRKTQTSYYEIDFQNKEV